MTAAARDRPGLGAAFWRFWSVELATETGIGLAVIALQTMVVLDLGGGAAEVGWLASSRWLPYVVLGLVVRARRREDAAEEERQALARDEARPDVSG